MSAQPKADHGDCFRQAWAFLLGFDPGTMPHFPLDFTDEEWFETFNAWLIEKHGCWSIYWESRVDFADLTACMKGRYVASVFVKDKGLHHAVVMENDQIIFDSKSRERDAYEFKGIFTVHLHITEQARVELDALRADAQRLERLNRIAIKAKEVAAETRKLGHPNGTEYYHGVENFAASINSALKHDQWWIEDFTRLSPLAGKTPSEIERTAIDRRGDETP